MHSSQGERKNLVKHKPGERTVLLEFQIYLFHRSIVVLRSFPRGLLIGHSSDHPPLYTGHRVLGGIGQVQEVSLSHRLGAAPASLLFMSNINVYTLTRDYLLSADYLQVLNLLRLLFPLFGKKRC